MKQASIVPSGKGVYRVNGILSFDTVPLLYLSSRTIFEHSCPVHLDLNGVRRSDSSGLVLLIQWLQDFSDRGQPLFFSNIPTQIQAIAEMSNCMELISPDASKSMN